MPAGVTVDSTQTKDEIAVSVRPDNEFKGLLSVEVRISI